MPLAFALVGLPGAVVLAAFAGCHVETRVTIAAPFLLLLAIFRKPLLVVIALGAIIGFCSQEVH